MKAKKALFYFIIVLIISLSLVLTSCSSGFNDPVPDVESVAIINTKTNVQPGQFTIATQVFPETASQNVTVSLVESIDGITISGKTITIANTVENNTLFSVKAVSVKDQEKFAVKEFTVTSSTQSISVESVSITNTESIVNVGTFAIIVSVLPVNAPKTCNFSLETPVMGVSVSGSNVTVSLSAANQSSFTVKAASTQNADKYDTKTFTVNNPPPVSVESVTITNAVETINVGAFAITVSVLPIDAPSACSYSLIAPVTGVSISGNNVTVSKSAVDQSTFTVKAASNQNATIYGTKTFTINNSPAVPVEIKTQADLLAINNGLDGIYYLGNDIILSGNFMGIGTPEVVDDNDDIIIQGNGFTGSFDGRGFTISGLSMTYSGIEQGEWSTFGFTRGLFNQIDNIGVIENLGLEGALSVNAWSGAIAGLNYGTIKNCWTNVTVHSVTGPVGGLAGVNKSTGKIINCYAIGVGTSDHATHGAGFVCANEGSITSSYALNTSIPYGLGFNKGTIANVLKTESQMKTESTYIGWDSNIWYIIDGEYPVLKTEGFVEPPPQIRITITNTQSALDYKVEGQRTLQITYTITNTESDDTVTFVLQNAVKGVSISESGFITLGDTEEPDDGAVFTVVVTSNENPLKFATKTFTISNYTPGLFTLISSYEQLLVLANTTNAADLAKNYRLACDIDASSGPFDVMIGSKVGTGTAFSGIFDGNGYKIYNLTSSGGTWSFGIFWTLTGTVKNVSFVIGEAGWRINNGGIVTAFNNGTIENCSFTGGDVIASSGFGSVICMENNTANSKIINCYSAISVRHNNSAVKSTKMVLVVNNNGGSITNTYFDKTVTTGVQIGNLVYAELDAACAKTTVELKSGIPFMGWDTNIWNFEEGEYPVLINSCSVN